MNYRKVYGGTPVGDTSLCESCVSGRTIRGYSASELISICTRTYPEMAIPFRVKECSSYMNGLVPDYCDLEEIAWDLTKVKGVKPAGFKLVGGKAVESGADPEADSNNEENEPAVVGFTKPDSDQD